MHSMDTSTLFLIIGSATAFMLAGIAVLEGAVDRNKMRRLPWQD